MGGPHEWSSADGVVNMLTTAHAWRGDRAHQGALTSRRSNGVRHRSPPSARLAAASTPDRLSLHMSGGAR
jgi:hypothetical protein